MKLETVVTVVTIVTVVTVVTVVTLVTVATVVTIVTVVTKKNNFFLHFFYKQKLLAKKFTIFLPNNFFSQTNPKTQIVMKLQNSNCDETQKLKLR